MSGYFGHFFINVVDYVCSLRSSEDVQYFQMDKEGNKYCPVVEDISIEDSELCLAVEQIEKE